MCSASQELEFKVLPLMTLSYCSVQKKHKKYFPFVLHCTALFVKPNFGLNPSSLNSVNNKRILPPDLW